MEDGLVVLKHPAADGLGREVKVTSGENLENEPREYGQDEQVSDLPATSGTNFQGAFRDLDL